MLPVPHRQIVLTIPKMLRIYFRYDRRLMEELFRHRVCKMLLKKGLLSAERVIFTFSESWCFPKATARESSRLSSSVRQGAKNLSPREFELASDD